MKNKKTLACLLTLCALMITLSACGTKNPYEDEDKTTYTLAGVTNDIPESMEIDSETSDTALYIEVPDAVLALVKAEVFTNYTDAAAFYEDYNDLLQNGGYESLTVGEITEEKIGGKKVSVLTYTYTIDGVTLNTECVAWTYSDGLVLLTAVTSPSYNDDLTDLVEYLVMHLSAK
jgi:predicted small lipoprotein YifL